MSEKYYLYTVHPKRTITGLSGIKALRVPKSLTLSKEDVKLCLQKASVYRRFAAEGKIERVTIANLDRLHNDRYISEEQWNKMNHNEEDVKVEEVKKDERGTVVPGIDTVEEAKPAVEEPKNEKISTEEDQVEAKQEDAVVEETVEESPTLEPEVESVVVADEAEEATVEETEEIESVETETSEEVQAEASEEDEKSENTSDESDNKQDNSNQRVKYNKNKHRK